MKKIVLYFIVLGIFLVNTLSAQVYTDNSVNYGVNSAGISEERSGIVDPSAYPVDKPDGVGYRIGYLYPNPATERCNLLILRNMGRMKVGIFTASGAMIKGFELERVFQGQVIPLDLRSLHAGLYYFLIRSSEGTEMHQLIIIKSTNAVDKEK